MIIEKDNFWKKASGLLGVFILGLFVYSFVVLCQAPDGELGKRWPLLSTLFILGSAILLSAIFYKNRRAENEWYQDVAHKIQSEKFKWIIGENIDGTFEVSIMNSDSIMTTDELRLFIAKNNVQNKEIVEKVFKFL